MSAADYDDGKADGLRQRAAEVADLKRRIRLARVELKECGAPWTQHMDALLDLRKPLPKGRTK